jgi:hypothetical protein
MQMHWRREFLCGCAENSPVYKFRPSPTGVADFNLYSIGRCLADRAAGMVPSAAALGSVTFQEGVRRLTVVTLEFSSEPGPSPPLLNPYNRWQNRASQQRSPPGW